MTVKELINELLNYKMDTEVILTCRDEKCEGGNAGFNIDGVTGSNDCFIEFTDWRKMRRCGK